MNFIRNIFTDDLAVDLGTVNTIIYTPERGIVINEPSAIAMNKFTGEVFGVGNEAFKLLGREPFDTVVHRPIRNGVIEDHELTQKMLAEFINRVHNGRNKRSRLVVGVPGSSTAVERRSVIDSAKLLKAARIDIVDEGLAAALGAGLEFNEEAAQFVVDIGGGTTNATIISSAAVVYSSSLRAAGISMDEAIRDYMRQQYEIQIGERMAEQVKKELGCACDAEAERRKDQRMMVIGKQLTDGMARAIEVTAAEIRTALEPVLSDMIMEVRRAVEQAHPDVTADIYYKGVLLTGGGALLHGIDERLQDDLNLPVRVAQEPLLAVALGAGKLLTDQKRLKRAAIRPNAPDWQASEELVVNW
jgi:rod shape-determining protein MreB and related proteins